MSKSVKSDVSSRLTAAARRTALLDVALDLLLTGGEPAITIGSVAERAGVTRALLYKHFDNRDDLIVELFRREAKQLDAQLIELVTNTPGGFEPKFRAMVRGLLDATDKWGTIFNPLRDTAAGQVGRREQRPRTRRTINYFAGLAAEDYDLPSGAVPQALTVLFGGLDPLMRMVRPGMGDADRDELVDLYVTMVIDALCGLKSPAGGGRPPGGRD